jgi:GxxExxY protein
LNENYKYSDTTEKIISCFYKLYNALGYGFLEKVHKNALIIELNLAGLKTENQKPVKVFYENNIVGNHCVDVIVEDCIIVELKASEILCEENKFQLINYLKATNLEVGILLNFGKKPEMKRKVFSNSHKPLRNHY